MAFDALDGDNGGLDELSSPLYPMGFPPPAPAATPAPAADELVPPTLPSGKQCYSHPAPAILIRDGVGLCKICVEKAASR